MGVVKGMETNFVAKRVLVTKSQHRIPPPPGRARRACISFRSNVRNRAAWTKDPLDRLETMQMNPEQEQVWRLNYQV